jgi:hypothetical protein
LDFGIVPAVWYFLFCIYYLFILFITLEHNIVLIKLDLYCFIILQYKTCFYDNRNKVIFLETQFFFFFSIFKKYSQLDPFWSVFNISHSETNLLYCLNQTLQDNNVWKVINKNIIFVTIPMIWNYYFYCLRMFHTLSYVSYLFKEVDLMAICTLEWTAKQLMQSFFNMSTISLLSLSYFNLGSSSWLNMIKLVRHWTRILITVTIRCCLLLIGMGHKFIIIKVKLHKKKYVLYYIIFKWKIAGKKQHCINFHTLNVFVNYKND